MRNLVLLFAAAAGVSRMTWAEVALVPLAFPGMQVNGETITSVPSSAFEINQSGQVMLSFDVIDKEGQKSRGELWLYNESGLQLVGKRGLATHGLAEDAEFISFVGDFDIGDGGHVAFVATDTSSPHTALWAGLPGKVRVVARQREAAPGLDGRTYDAGFDGIQLDGTGGITFHQGAGAINSTDLRAVWYKSANAAQPSLIAADGMPAPGTQLKFFYVGSAEFDNAGQAVVYALIGDEPAINGMWRWKSENGLSPVAGPETTAPNSGGEHFAGGGVGIFRMVSDGTIVFAAGTRHPETGHISFGIWAADESEVRQIAFTGIEERVRLSFLGGVSSDGKTVFGKTEFDGDFERYSLWGVDGEKVSMLIGPDEFRALGMLHAINSSGRVVFDAFNDENKRELWTLGPDGTREMIVRQGDIIEFGGFQKTIDWLQADRNGLSDTDRFAFQLQFTDGTTATMLAVLPEPAGVGLGAGLLVLGIMRRQRRLL